MQTIYKQKLSLKRVEAPLLDQLSNTWHVAHFLRNIWDKDELATIESFNVVYLDSKIRPVCWAEIAKGGFHSSSIDIRLIMTHAILSNAFYMVLAHNHPSGDTRPSPSDKRTTKLIMEAGATMNIRVLDHLILSPDGETFSFDERNILGEL